MIATRARALVLRCDDGVALPLPVGRWLREAVPEEHQVLAMAVPPVLDVGCGPGRHTLALARRGVAVLGLDPAPTAVWLGRSRGASILQRSVFGRVPCPGRWGSALLLDGNVGIGGDPVALLRRVGSLVRPGGLLLVELEPPGTGLRLLRARIEALEETGPWFPWAVVGSDRIGGLAAEAGMEVERRWSARGRWFASLRVHRRAAVALAGGPARFGEASG